MVKIFTMVKDEVDVIRDWIIYHGCMFGWQNIHIIDNYSTDGTYEAISEFKDLIHIFREPDYKKKGEYMKNLINIYSYGGDCIAFPIDIDEFIIYYDRNDGVVSVDKHLINSYMHTLPEAKIYKCNYINPILTNKYGHSRAQAEIDYGYYDNRGDHAKSFIDVRYYHGDIDHGNHFSTNDYYLTNIALVHFHDRNIEQVKKKNINNLLGLGYNLDIGSLYQFIIDNPECTGHHHISKQISIQENRYEFSYNSNPDLNNTVCITPLKKKIIEGFY